MATSHFFIQPEEQRNTNLVNGSTEQPQKTRGRKPGSKTFQHNPKKLRQRGMGVAYLERIRIEEEKKQMAQNPNPNPNPMPDPVVVLQGFPSYGGSNTPLGGGCRNRFYGGGGGGVWPGQIMIDPVSYPSGFVENSSIPIPQVYNNHPCDICFKKKRLEEDHNLTKCSLSLSPPRQENDHLLQQDQRSKSQSGFFYDHIIPKPAFTNHTGLKEEFGSYVEANPSNGSGGVKEYEFFPRKYDDFGKPVSVATPIGDCSPNSSTIDLSLKL